MAGYPAKWMTLTVGVEGHLNSLDLQLQRQVLELCALIGINLRFVSDLDKYPTRAFAVSGSSAEIAYSALRVFLKEHVVRKMGVLIPTEVLSRLHIINDMPVSEDLKRGRFGDALKDVGVEKAQIIRLLIAFLTECVLPTRVADDSGLSSSSDDLSLSQKAFGGVASMLVEESSARDFISILQCIVEGPSMVFGTSHFEIMLT